MSNFFIQKLKSFSIFFISLSFTQVVLSNNLPDIGNPADSLLSLSEERLLGEEFYRDLTKKSKLLNDPETLSYLQHIGNNLVNHLDDAEQDYKFFLVNDNAINAFAVPGGYIGVNKGLIAASKNESELAGVLAHEIAHVHQRHIARRMFDMQSSSAISFATILAGFLAASQGYSQQGSALLYGGLAAQQQRAINFTRENEIEADRIGINLLNEADYNPQGIVSFFQILQQQNNGQAFESYQSLLTHPLDSIRIAEAQSRIAQIKKNQSGTIHTQTEYDYMHARIVAFNQQDKKAFLKREQLTQTSNKAASLLKQYRLAQAYELNQQWQAAAILYKALLAQKYENAFVLGLARAYINNGQAEQAVTLLEKNIRIQPDHYATNLYYAEALLKSKQANKTIKVINDFLRQQQPLNSEVYQLLSQAYQQNQQLYLGKKTQIEYLYQNGNYNAAIGLLRTLINADETDPIEKTLLEARLEQILNRQKAIKSLG